MESAVKQSAGSGLYYTIVSNKKKKKKIWRSRSRSYLSYPCRLPKFEIVPISYYQFDYLIIIGMSLMDDWRAAVTQPILISKGAAERANQIQELIHPSLFLIFLLFQLVSSPSVCFV